jgi:hypothetical protein
MAKDEKRVGEVSLVAEKKRFDRNTVRDSRSVRPTEVVVVVVCGRQW